MTNQANTNTSGHAPPAPPAKLSNAKKQALLQQHKQQRVTQEPWLFQSINVLHHSPLPLPSLRALTASDTSASIASPLKPPVATTLTSPAVPFYLDVESLRTLLPASNNNNRRHRPQSSSDDSARQEVYGSPQARGSRHYHQRHAPARLEALSPTTRGVVVPAAAAPPPPRTRKRRHNKNKPRSTRLTAVRRKFALRNDTAKTRRRDYPSAADGVAVASTTKPKVPMKSHDHSPHHPQHQHTKRHHHKRLGFGRVAMLDDDEEAHTRAATPPEPLDDLDEARRQKETIAAQLGLSLEEYEALDAAFGGGDDGDGIDGDDGGGGSMTARYHAVFAQYDADGSGAISPVELRELLIAAGEDMDDAELAKVIAQADTDGDGEIDFDEFMGLMRARKRLLLVAKTMGASGTGPASSSKHHTSGSKSSSKPTLRHGQSLSSASPSPSPASSSFALSSPLPPLRLTIAPSKKQPAAQFNRHYSRPTPTCLRPGAQVDVTQLRRELAMAEFGIQELNSKVRDGVHWVQQHCPVTSLKAQVYCHRWGMEKVHQLFVRLQSQAISRAYQKWKSFLMYERNKLKANLFLKCKGSQKLTEILAKRARKTLRRRLAKWKSECAIDARNETIAAVVELQRVWRGKLARQWKWRETRHLACTRIQSLVRGHLGRCRGRRIRRAVLEHESACVLQRCYRGYSGKRLAKALFKAQQDALAARRIQRAFRNHQRRVLLRAVQRTKLEHDSAVQLQCCMRSFLARKQRRLRSHQRRRVRCSVVIQRHTRGLLARRHVLDTKRRTAAAITIQTRYRAHRSRWQCVQLRNEKAERERRRVERDAAIQIQTAWRGAHARRQHAMRRVQLRDAQTLLAFRRLTSALRLQCVFRGYRARRHAQRLRYEKLKWMNLTLMNQSALCIQACWRGFHGRLASHLRLQAKRALAHEEILAAKKIQSVARGKLARGELRRRERKRAQIMAMQHTRARAALKIQTVFRGKHARKMAARVKQEHEDHARAALHRLVQQTKARAAIKIQCSVRIFLARVKYRNRRQDAARKIQESELRLKRAHAAIVIQCALRRAKARRLLVLRRHEFEKRISLMASEKAHDEIERLREEQEEELARLRVQLLLQESKASEESVKLRKQLEVQREQELERREQEAQELAKLKLEALMQQHAQVSDRKILEFQKQQDAERLREQLDQQIRQTQVIEDVVRTQENEQLAQLKMTALLQTTTIASATSKTREHDQEAVRLEQEAAQLQRAAKAMQREQAKLKIQSVCLKYMAKRRLERLQAEQASALAKLHSEEDKVRLRALQEKEMALAKLKAMMDDDARAREQEIKALEAQMLDRARLEKERIATRNSSARKIQACVRGFLGRQRVKAIQRKIDKEREDRAKAMEDQLAEAEAKVAAALHGTSGGSDGGGGDGADGSSNGKGAVGLASGNPEDWVEYWDESAQASYFYNVKTQEASWTRPFSAPASSKALEIVAAAMTPMATVDYDADANAYGGGGYAGGQGDANGAGGGYAAAGYADEYGFYDQYGQYHYYDDQNGANATATANTYQAQTAAMAAAGMMYPGYAAAAAYAYQTAMAFGANPMMYGATAMPYNQQMMMANPMMLAAMGANTAGSTAVAAAASAESATAVESAATEASADGGATAGPPDPWEQFFDQYTGAAYYYNNITGERYWA